MGFRDSNQDLLGFVHLIPARARSASSTSPPPRCPDGSAYHQYQPLTKKGNADIGGGFNDDPLWLILGTAAYIKETGDWRSWTSRCRSTTTRQNAATLFEHLRALLRPRARTTSGPHGLPLIGRADWNDCLNLNCFSDEPDESFQTDRQRADGRTAESVLHRRHVRLHRRRTIAELCRRASAAHAEAQPRASTHGEHGATVARARLGRRVVPARLRLLRQQGRLARNARKARSSSRPQGFCVMAGIGVDDGRARQALDSVREHLDTEHGIVLNSPAYTEYHVELGEISSYPPGYKENAGIFCHNNPWIMIAETVLGRGDRAFEYYRKIAPAYREEISEIHRAEPYVYAQMIAGKDAARLGEAKNSWLTGTAAWNFVAITQYILGVKPELAGLRVNPCISNEIPAFTIVRKCRGAEYRIHVANGGVSRPTLKVDGKPIDGTLVPYAKPGSVVKIDCES